MATAQIFECSATRLRLRDSRDGRPQTAVGSVENSRPKIVSLAPLTPWEQRKAGRRSTCAPNPRLIVACDEGRAPPSRGRTFPTWAGTGPAPTDRFARLDILSPAMLKIDVQSYNEQCSQAPRTCTGAQRIELLPRLKPFHSSQVRTVAGSARDSLQFAEHGFFHGFSEAIRRLVQGDSLLPP